MYKSLLALLLGLFALPLAADERPLTMAFNPRPPYHYFVDTQPIPQGMMADILIRVLYDANLRVEFVEMPGHRIMAETQKGWPFCSFTWFQNRERSRFAKFTLPLWKDAPFVLVTLKENYKRLSTYERLGQLLRSEELVIGTKEPISYGSYVDQLLANPSNRARVESIPTSQLKIIQLLDNGRFDAVILTPEEAPGLFREAHVDFNRYVSVDYRDIPEGDHRRIMCSKGVSDQTIERLNASIRKLAPQGALP